MRRLCFALFALITCATLLPAQEKALGEPLDLGEGTVWRVRESAVGTARAANSLVFLSDEDARAFLPLSNEATQSRARVAILDEESSTAKRRAAFRAYRLLRAPRDGRHVLVARGARCRAALDLIAAMPYEFRSLVLLEAPAGLRFDVKRLAVGRVLDLVHDGTCPLAADIGRLSGWRLLDPDSEPRLSPEQNLRRNLIRTTTTRVFASAEGPGRTLDRFHRAASLGDEDVYFPLFTEDGVFLGTDATERWTKSEFRDFALPYFKRGSAWIFVPLARNITLDPGGTIAFFDEILGSASYGECRGSGVLRKEGDSWRVAQYNLGVPVPNALLKDVVADIRRLERGETSSAPTTVILVRHAEKASETERDPMLSPGGQSRARHLARLLSEFDVDALYASEYQRTQLTLTPLATARGTEVRPHPARDARGLVRLVRERHAGETVVIAGHSNTVPMLARLFGASMAKVAKKTDYDDLIVLTLRGARTRTLALTQGFRPTESRSSSRPSVRPQPKAGSGRK